MEELQSRIALFEGYPVEHQKLRFNGRTLKRGELLRDHEIKDGDTIFLFTVKILVKYAADLNFQEPKKVEQALYEYVFKYRTSSTQYKSCILEIADGPKVCEGCQFWCLLCRRACMTSPLLTLLNFIPSQYFS